MTTSALTHLRHPMRWLNDLTGGYGAYPLVVLFGLNAVDELDRAAFGILLPEIREHFGLDLAVVLGLVSLSAIAALALQVPIAQYADRHRRVPLAVAGALVWSLFSGLTGLAMGLIMLTIARSGSSVAKAVIDPTHNSLIADFYPPDRRARAFAVHRTANAVGAFVGPLTAGLLAYSFGWRLPFLVFMVPTVVFAVLALRIREPVRGRFERLAGGASEEAADITEAVPSAAEAWRTVYKVPTLRRIWMALPFLAVAFVGFGVFAGILYAEEFGLDERARGVAAAITEPFQVVGIVLGTRLVTRRFGTDVRRLVRFLGTLSVVASFASLAFAVAPNIVVAVVVSCVISAALAALVPGLLAALSLAIPPRVRATGFSVAALWSIPGLLVLPLIGWIAERSSIRWGMVVMLPLFLVGSLIIRSAANLIEADIAQVWRGAAARGEALYQRRSGATDVMLLRGVDAGYEDRQVLFSVDLDVREGEVLALLGTNGAGKSTLLNTITGVVEADRGTVVFDGRDITHTPPHEIAALGVVQLPGGKAVFPGLTVAEHLRLAQWTTPDQPALPGDVVEGALEHFPVLRQRLDEPAGDLSGGQQHMLALAMALVMRPRVLLIDELSLGLAPSVLAQMLPVVRRVARDGAAVVIVEQSVDVALAVADRAVFLERGSIRFEGSAGDLAGRRDLLRSVFLAHGAPDATVEPSPASPPETVSVPTTTPALEVRGLSRTFGGIRAVDGVSFTVATGEILGVIGPNGAGKTTLFDLISGLVPANGGSVWLGGVDVSGRSAAQRSAAGLGRSFQDARLFPALTVAETLTVALERTVRRRSTAAAVLRLPQMYDEEMRLGRRVAALAESMGLAPFAQVPVRDLSTGTRRIVELACQIAHGASVILLDEPSAGVAKSEVEALGTLLRRVRGELGAALVVVDHDLSLLGSIADRLLALDRGVAIAAGRPADVLNDERVVASYLGPLATSIDPST